jgi:tRNA A37 threonylcarbamoyladenosine modification protein TsaB
MNSTRESRLTNLELAPQEHIVGLIQQALKEARVGPKDISCIAYTKVSPEQASLTE